MKRTILAGILVMTAGALGLMAQKGNAKGDQSQAAAQQKGPAPKSQGELEAVQAMLKAQGNPDAMIAASEALLMKYADTDFKDIALLFEANAYQAKGDPEKAQLFAERALDANPKNFQASLLLADTIVQHTRENDLDRDQKLAKANKYANDTIASVTAAAKPNPQITDQQWEDLKKDVIAEAHESIGLGSLVAKKYDDAITELKKAVDGAVQPQPAFKVRLATAYQGAGKYDESIALAEQVMADAQAPQQVKQIAQSVRAGSVVAKNKAAGQGGTPSAPPQVEVKKP